MSATSFGGSFGLVASNDQKAKSAFVDRLKQAALDAQFPFLRYMPFMPPSINKEFNDMITRIVSTRRKEMASKAPPQRDLLQLLIDTQDSDPVGFTDLHMREEMALFMLAGSDTSSVTLTCTLSLLVRNTDKLDKLVQEMDEAFPDINDEITFTKTQDLPYLNAVINESMRVMPVIRVGV
jgi:cytochrome P450